MSRGVGMYRRAELRRPAGADEATARVAAALTAAASCAAGNHYPETDAETGDEVCRRCGTVVDGYPDVAESLAPRE